MAKLLDCEFGGEKCLLAGPGLWLLALGPWFYCYMGQHLRRTPSYTFPLTHPGGCQAPRIRLLWVGNPHRRSSSNAHRSIICRKLFMLGPARTSLPCLRSHLRNHHRLRIRRHLRTCHPPDPCQLYQRSPPFYGPSRPPLQRPPAPLPARAQMLPAEVRVSPQRVLPGPAPPQLPLLMMQRQLHRIQPPAIRTWRAVRQCKGTTTSKSGPLGAL